MKKVTKIPWKWRFIAGSIISECRILQRGIYWLPVGKIFHHSLHDMDHRISWRVFVAPATCNCPVTFGHRASRSVLSRCRQRGKFSYDPIGSGMAEFMLQRPQYLQVNVYIYTHNYGLNHHFFMGKLAKSQLPWLQWQTISDYQRVHGPSVITRGCTWRSIFATEPWSLSAMDVTLCSVRLRGLFFFSTRNGGKIGGQCGKGPIFPPAQWRFVLLISVTKHQSCREFCTLDIVWLLESRMWNITARVRGFGNRFKILDHHSFNVEWFKILNLPSGFESFKPHNHMLNTFHIKQCKTIIFSNLKSSLTQCSSFFVSFMSMIANDRWCWLHLATTKVPETGSQHLQPTF